MPTVSLARSVFFPSLFPSLFSFRLFLSLFHSLTLLLFSISLHFGTLEFRSYLRILVPALSRTRHPLSFLPSVLFLSFYRRMARPDLRAYQSESERQSVSKRDSRHTLSLSFSLPYRVLSSTRRTEVEDGGSEKETDKRMVLILKPLTLPPVLPYPDTLPLSRWTPKFCSEFSLLFLFFFILTILPSYRCYYYFPFHAR